MKIAALPKEERPRESALAKGVEHSSDAELIALFVGGGVKGHSALEIADEMLREAGSLANLCTYSYKELLAFPGIGKTKAIQLSAAFEMLKRLQKPAGFLPSSYEAKDVYSFYADPNKTQEEAMLVLLSPSLKPIGDRLLYRGSSSKLPFSSSDVLKHVFSSGAKSFVLVHNHPSGVALPSMEDFASLTNLEISCRKMGIKMADFVILGENSYYSLRENGGNPARS